MTKDESIEQPSGEATIAQKEPVACFNVFRSTTGERNTRFLELKSLPDGEHYFYTSPPAQQEPVSHSIVAGALFDFMGWLTSRNECLVLSSTDDAAPAADAIKDFAHMRNLSIDDAKVREWQEHLASPPTLSLAQRKPLTDEEYEALVEDLGDWSRYVEVDTAHQALTEHVRQVLAAHGIKGDA